MVEKNALSMMEEGSPGREDHSVHDGGAVSW